MYDIIITTHSILRWLVLLAFVIALYRSVSGWSNSRTWVKADRNSGLFLTVMFDIQLLLGLVLFIFLSPLTESAFQDMGGAMSNPVLRFFTVEHTLLMLIALLLVHLGASKSRKANEDKKKHKRAFIYYIIAFFLVLVAIPWPFLSYGRPWI